MIDNRTWVLLRWPLAILLMVLVVWFTIPQLLDALAGTVEISPDVPASSPGAAAPAAGAEPVEDGAARAVADVSVVDGTVALPDDETLVLGEEPRDTVLVAFPLIPGDAACVARVLLELTVLQASPAELGVWPSTVTDIDELTPGERAPRELLVGSRPAGRALTDGSPGRLRWDVTAAYSQWVSDDLAPQGTPLVLGIRATDIASDDPGVVFAALESGAAGAPTLTWTGEEGCGQE